MSKEPKHVIKFRESYLKSSEDIVSWLGGLSGDIKGTGDKKPHGGVLIVTNERVVFYRKGFFGEIQESILLNDITSIDRKSMLGHHVLRIHTSHDQIQFNTFVGKEPEQQLIDAIEAGRNKSNAAPQTQVLSQSDPINDLKKLGELKELGVITTEEFQEKKTFLLAKM